MNIEELRSYCLQKKGTSEDMPFGEETLVFRVMHKIFALTNLNGEKLSVNLKCDPDKALELRDRYPEILPGYHMNKRHWNTVDFEGTLESDILKHLIDHSYELVMNGLTKSDREKLSQF